jgi:hypothetical protein
MIGLRATLTAAVAVAACAATLSADVAGVARSRDAVRLLHERASAAASDLDALAARLSEATDAARAGAARTVTGDEPPGPSLEAAARLLEDAEPVASAARAAVDALRGAIQLAGAGVAVEQPVETGELSSVAAQLRATAAAADAFAEMRRRTERVPVLLDQALAALGRGDLDEAERLADAARTDHDAVSAWEVDLVTLPIWIETTDAMIADVETIVRATRAGDRAAAEAAAQAFAGRSDEATTADRALRIAIGEGGSAVSGAPLRRLAELQTRVSATREFARGLTR